MYEIFRTNVFKKDYKKLNNKDKELVKNTIKLLANGEKLPQEFKEHKLIGNYLGCKNVILNLIYY